MRKWRSTLAPSPFASLHPGATSSLRLPLHLYVVALPFTSIYLSIYLSIIYHLSLSPFLSLSLPLSLSLSLSLSLLSLPFRLCLMYSFLSYFLRLPFFLSFLFPSSSLVWQRWLASDRGSAQGGHVVRGLYAAAGRQAQTDGHHCRAEFGVGAAGVRRVAQSNAAVAAATSRVFTLYSVVSLLCRIWSWHSRRTTSCSK